jgi:hypothetical protein
MARARAIIEQAEKPAPPTDREIGPAILATTLLVIGGLVLCRALLEQDTQQIQLHQREVSPVLRHD